MDGLCTQLWLCSCLWSDYVRPSAKRQYILQSSNNYLHAKQILNVELYVSTAIA